MSSVPKLLVLVVVSLGLACRGQAQLPVELEPEPLSSTLTPDVRHERGSDCFEVAEQSEPLTTARSRELEALDPCLEFGVIVARRSVELRAPRAGMLRGGGAALRGEDEPLYTIEAGDDVALVEIQRAELEEAKAARDRYAAEQGARARELRVSEELGEFLAESERDAASDAHVISSRELRRADAARKTAAARISAQEARIRSGQLVAPFPGRVVWEFALPGTWVEAGQLLARFASTQDLVLRVGLPAALAIDDVIEVGWSWPDHSEQRFTASLRPTHDEIDELSGLRIYEGSLGSTPALERPLGSAVHVFTPACRGRPLPEENEHERD